MGNACTREEEPARGRRSREERYPQEDFIHVGANDATEPAARTPAASEDTLNSSLGKTFLISPTSNIVIEVAAATATSSSKRDQFLAKLAKTPFDAKAYNNLGKEMKGNETVTLPDGRVVNRRDLFIISLKMDPCLEVAYCNLAASSPSVITMPDGRVMTRRDLYVEAIKMCPKAPHASYYLASCLKDGETVTISGKGTLTQRDLLIAAIRGGRREAHAFNNLANSLKPDEGIDIGGRTVTRRDLYTAALKVDPNNSNAMNNVAKLLSPTEKFSLPDGRKMSRRELLLQAVHLNPKSGVAHYNLGITIRKNETSITLIDGRSVTRRDLFLHAIALSPRDPGPYYCLGKCLHPDETIAIPDGRVVTRNDLFVECLRLNPDYRRVKRFITQGTVVGGKLETEDDDDDEECFADAQRAW